jgi:hypothetical protein
VHLQRRWRGLDRDAHGHDHAQFTTADGYIWKFMATVPPSAATKFQTNNFSPVKKVGANPGSSDPYYNQYLVEQAAVDGALSFIKVVNQGTATRLPQRPSR